jgi:transposase
MHTIHSLPGPVAPRKSRSGGATSEARRPAAEGLPRASARRPGPARPEVPARHAKRRFTTAYKLDILRRADACTRPGELGALLRREGLYSSHLVTWRRQREHGLTPKKRGRKATASDPRVKTLERERAALATENRRLERRLQRAETIIAYQKKVHELLGIPLNPLPSDEDD